MGGSYILALFLHVSALTLSLTHVASLMLDRRYSLHWHMERSFEMSALYDVHALVARKQVAALPSRMVLSVSIKNHIDAWNNRNYSYPVSCSSVRVGF